MKYLMMLLIVIFSTVSASCFACENVDTIDSSFSVTEEMVYVDVTNNSEETVALKGLAFNQTGATFAVRFRDEEQKILKISEGSLNKDDFISGNVFSSDLYLDNEIPRVSLSPQEKIIIEAPIRAIIWHLSQESIDLLSQNGIEWQFIVSFSSSHKDYDFKSEWLAVDLENISISY